MVAWRLLQRVEFPCVAIAKGIEFEAYPGREMNLLPHFVTLKH